MAEDLRWLSKALVICVVMSILATIMGWVISNIVSSLQTLTVAGRSVVFERDSEGWITAIRYV